MSIILAYIFYFVAASASPLQRRWLAKKKNPNFQEQIYFASQVSFIIALLTLLLPLWKPITYSGDNIFLVLDLILGTGIFGGGFYLISYITDKYIDVGVKSFIGNLNVPLVVIFSTIFLSETLDKNEIIGAGLLIAGVILISLKHFNKRFAIDKYFLLLLFSVLLLTADIIIERVLQKTVGFSLTYMIMCWSQFLFMWIISLSNKGKSSFSSIETITTGFLRFLHIISYGVLLFMVGNLSYIVSVTTFKVVFVFIGGIVFLGERDHLVRKIIGSIIAVIGLLLMK